MRREAASALLTGLYAIRREINRTLEWLAEETVGAQCTYLRDEPRVCVFGTEGGIWAEVENEANGVRASTIVAYQQARDFSRFLNEEQVAALRNERDQAAMARNDAIERMRTDFLERVKEIRYGQEIRDQRLQEIANEAARMAWIQFAVSIVQDQVTLLVEEAVEDATEQMAAQASNEAGGDSGTRQGLTMIVLESQEGETSGGGSVSQIGGVVQQSSSGSTGGLKANKTVLVAMVPKQSERQAGGSGITNNFAESVYGSLSGMNNMQKLALWLPEVPRDTTNILAGVGDGMTLGVTRHVRNWVGLSAEVDTESGMYRNGTLIGFLGPGAGTLKIGKQLITTGKFQKKFGNFSVLMKAGHGQRSQGISLIHHGSKGRSGRLVGFDVVTKLKGPGDLASKLPHINVGRFTAHLPWEPRWLVPAVITTQLERDSAKQR